MTSDVPEIEPNELTCRYEATQNLYELLDDIVDSLNKIDEEEGGHMVNYRDRLDDMSDDLGRAQNNQNDISIHDYREVHGDLPTLETDSLTMKERELLTELDVIDGDEEPPLPVDDSGERLPLLVTSSQEVEEALETLKEYKQYISNDSAKILHVADTHIGYSNRPEWKDDVDESDRVHCLEAFEEVGDMAIRENVDAVVHAGDVFDDSVSTDHWKGFKDVLGELEEAGISFHFVVGNHDQCTLEREGKDAVAKLIDMAEEGRIALLSDEPTTIGGVVSVYGVGYMGLGKDRWEGDGWSSWNTSWWESPDLSFDGQPDTTHNVLCTHGKFEVDGSHGTLNRDGEEVTAEKVAEESNLDFSKLLLGDKHSSEDGVGRHEDAHYSGPTKCIGSDDGFTPKVNIFEFYEGGKIEYDEEYLSESV